MIDFGCVKTFPEDFLDGCIRLVQNYLSGNHSGFTDELVKMEFLKNSDAEEATEKMIKELLTEFAELLSDVYRKPVFDFSDSSFREKLNAMFKREWKSGKSGDQDTLSFSTELYSDYCPS